MVKNINAEVSNLSFTARETAYGREQYFAGMIRHEMFRLNR